MDLGLRSATPMLTQRHQYRCTRRAALKFSIGGREPIPAIFDCEGWYTILYHTRLDTILKLHKLYYVSTWSYPECI